MECNISGLTYHPRTFSYCSILFFLLLLKSPDPRIFFFSEYVFRPPRDPQNMSKKIIFQKKDLEKWLWKSFQGKVPTMSDGWDPPSPVEATKIILVLLKEILIYYLEVFSKTVGHRQGLGAIFKVIFQGLFLT